MLFDLWVASALCAVTLAAPTLTSSDGAAERPADMQILSDYFQLVASKVQTLKDTRAPKCDYSKAVMPIACKPTLYLRNLPIY